ncbi:hypothetical protein GCM10011374_36220 [Kocuria dechangensis]|uniref:Uncharacterized protein n=1 Tax=Kocuria dechangensis TaxID=1176249 RepID=A0A917H6B6_9MICC|nr:hypothetical protein [Kocuria dechangensis]GGG68600.1 hypothetical protein GCM10011374_36220 [Kocuria dechangensis]
MSTHTANVQIAPLDDAVQADTATAKRRAKLMAHKDSCANLGIEMDPVLAAELQGLRRDSQVDPADDVIFIETLSTEGHFGHRLDNEAEDREPETAIGWMVAEGIIAVSLTFREGVPVINLEPLHDGGVDVIVIRDADGSTLYSGETVRL